MRRFSSFAAWGVMVALAAIPLARAASIDPGDQAAIEAALPKNVTIEGTVSGVDVGDNRITINFKGAEKTSFSAVILQRAMEAVQGAFDGDIAKAINGRQIKITGKLSAYHDKPQMVINNAKQIVVEDAAATEPATAPATAPASEPAAGK